MNGSLGKFGTALALLLAVASCAHLESEDARHPLNGKVWDVAGQRFIEPATLKQHAATARFVLLGEIHDNRMHHVIQEAILKQVVESGRRPALVMEQYDRDQQPMIDAILASQLSQRDKLKAFQALMPGGWEWDGYQPLLRLALQYQLPVVAANLTREELRLVARQGFNAALGDGEQARLALDSAWSPQRQERLVKDIYETHCRKMPPHVASLIANAQRARDAVMADMMIRFKGSGAIAIVGSGHARRDMAIPLYLAARMPDATLLSVGMMEVDAPRDPAAYAAGPFGLAFDYVWFTARMYRRGDPCDSIPTRQPAPLKPPA